MLHLRVFDTKNCGIIHLYNKIGRIVMNNKKGFTFAETLTTLTIIGVLAALLIPVLNHAKPDKDKLFFKKGIYTIQNALSQVYRVNRGALEKEGDTTFLCNQMAEYVNTVGTINCGESSYDNPNFISNDGVRFWGLENAFSDATADTIGKKAKIVYIDRTLKASDRTKLAGGTLRDGKNAEGLKLYINISGKTSIHNADTYEAGLINSDTISK